MLCLNCNHPLSIISSWEIAQHRCILYLCKACLSQIALKVPINGYIPPVYSEEEE